jgi:hypothetical protein|tara:strand:+ start:24967 stop:25146 length:180 start_codon:yes stop_codon:yes gene_type:complete
MELNIQDKIQQNFLIIFNRSWVNEKVEKYGKTISLGIRYTTIGVGSEKTLKSNKKKQAK